MNSFTNIKCTIYTAILCLCVYKKTMNAVENYLHAIDFV